MDIRKHNSAAWDQNVAAQNPWTRPVSRETIAAAKQGNWSVQLTTTKSVPTNWFPRYPDLSGCRILALASGGGQQGPIFAAAGGEVTVFDNSPAQLAQDQLVAERDGLQLKTMTGDMADLSAFPDDHFDFIFHPVSNCFAADPIPVWNEAFRVLKPGGTLLSGVMNPDYYIFDYQKAETEGQLEVQHALPYSDLDSLTEAELAAHLQSGEPVEFSHTMESLIGGQMEAGFGIYGFYEDRYTPDAGDAASQYIPVCFATKAHKG